ncbi:hypothetical protein [Rhizobium sp. NXC24]|uniref:hypothetical protein n=1 Tax=Rhizobium sp. NXC24 TaxID=2048897 RepID=UPI001FDEEA40|nr:hypothetical protein [Rhizobium sp. NXC24]
MVGTAEQKDRRKRARIDVGAEASALLDEASKVFQLDRAETLRRIIRATLDVGPALTADNSRTFAALASQVRMVGRNLSQLLHAIHSGRVVPMEAALPIWEALDERVRAVDTELTAMTIAHGLKLRQAAHLLDGEDE